MKNTSQFIALSLTTVLALVILSIGFASANTLVGGTIYDGSLGNPVSGVNIIVHCDSMTPLSTTSLGDGTYAVVFDTESCSYINATAEGYESMQITVNIQDDTDEEEDSSKHSSSGSLKRTYSVYLCGNGLCDSGETSNTCLRDCPLPEEKIQPSLVSENNTKEIITLEQEPNNSVNPGITGAVTGTNKRSNTWAIVAIGLLLIVVIFFIIKQLHKKADITSGY